MGDSSSMGSTLRQTVSNMFGTRRNMATHSRVRWILAVAGTSITFAFAAIGLWERSRILSQPFLNGSTMWDSTARFHVWPWPFKFAAIWSMPAFLSGSILMLPIRLIWTTLPEGVDLVPSAVLTALLWHRVGSRLERHSPVTRWAALVLFCTLSLIGAFIPMGYTGWVPYGVLMWCIAVLVLRKSPARGTASPSSPRHS